MYWPNGVPRVYAVNGPGIPRASSNEDAKPESESSEEQIKTSLESNGPDESPTKPGWAGEAITGLCVARGGHIFATMTESSIAIWQTRVGIRSLFPWRLLTIC